MADDTLAQELLAEGRCVERAAVISECSRYRYLLLRTWEPTKARCVYVMLNPSTADADIDDPTIRSCIRLAKEKGFGGLAVVNLYAWRATDPKELPAKQSEALGSANPRAIETAVSQCSTVICAWGAHPYATRNVAGALDIIRLYQRTPYCFGVTQSGAPKHPLYIKSGTPLIPFVAGS